MMKKKWKTSAGAVSKHSPRHKQEEDFEIFLLYWKYLPNRELLFFLTVAASTLPLSSQSDQLQIVSQTKVQPEPEDLFAQQVTQLFVVKSKSSGTPVAVHFNETNLRPKPAESRKKEWQNGT
jgi:hypothetical protein